MYEGRHVKPRYARQKNDSASSLVKRLYEFVTLFCQVLLPFLVVLFVFRTAMVQGESMVPTLEDGDRLVLFCAGYEPQRGDTVVIRREAQQALIKRVVAVAGDTVSISDVEHRLYLNGQAVEEEGTTPPFQLEQPVTVPEGFVFVMGDNRYNSHDSRHKDIGLVAVERIVGKAVWRIYPWEDFGGLN